MINKLGSKSLETKIDSYMSEYVSDYVSDYVAVSENQIESNRVVLEKAFDDFAIPVYENAPFTTIQNRAQVTKSLRAVAGIERIMVRSINRLEKEFGPNGESVFEADNKDSRIRFVGSGWTVSGGASGTFPFTTTVTDFVEIVFYGTGLNLIQNINTTTADHKVSIDGGAYSPNIFSSTWSGVLDNRNYSSNAIVGISSGLTLGWHNIRIRLDATNLRVFGFEILNERNNILINPGSGVSNGYMSELVAESTSNFNEGVSGIKGARIVKYINSGTVNSAIQEVDTFAQYLTSTNHTNEEIVRRINFREFGANRADDFSTLTTVRNASFTLGDGTTTLMGNTVTGGTVLGAEVIGFPTAGTSNVTITFVGTGLDIVGTSTIAYTGSIAVRVDGNLVGNITSANVGFNITKIASGLPYGTHTVKLSVNVTSAGNWALGDFIIYHPKKPAIPSTAFEVADYNLMADYISAPAGANTVSSGVLRKSNAREAVYSGTWTIPADYSGLYSSNGFYTESATQNNYVEYTFFGTGFDWKHVLNTNQTTNCTVTLNGVALNSSYPGSSSITVEVNGGTYSGTLSGASALLSTLLTNVLNKNSAINAASFKVSGLPLKKHVLRFTQSAATTVNTFMTSYYLDIITPIHINKSSLRGGSESLISVSKYSPEKKSLNSAPDLSKAKAWIVFGDTQIYSSYNISAMLKVQNYIYDLFLEKQMKSDTYVAIGSGQGASSATAADGIQIDIINMKRNFLRIGAAYNSGSGAGNEWSSLPSVICVVFFGELIDE